MPNILGTVNSRTSLTTIQQMIEGDFGITIGKETARLIRNAASVNSLVWTSAHIITTDLSRIRIARAEDGRIEANVHFSYTY